MCPDLPVFSIQALLSGFSGYMETPSPVAMMLPHIQYRIEGLKEDFTQCLSDHVTLGHLDCISVLF